MMHSESGPPKVAWSQGRLVAKSLLTAGLRIALSVFVAVAALVFVFQHQMIYFPSAYGKAAERFPGVALDYKTSEGKQRSYYIAPQNRELAAPKSLWVLFGGNASLALEWQDVVASVNEPDAGFLLIDYPGYGACEGAASPDTIRESADKALETLAAQLPMERTALESRLRVMGHSLGCGAGLEFATRHPVSRLILMSPFTSLRDMARRTVGFPLCYLLRSNFDNRARLLELAARPNPPQITILHGAEDTIIPSSMGRELASLVPQIASFTELPGAGHNDLFSSALPGIAAAMRR